MNFAALKLLYSYELEKSKREAPGVSRPYVVAAYKKVFKIINTYYNDKDVVTNKKIEELPITQHMKTKLIKLSKMRMSKTAQSSKKAQNEEQLKLDLGNLLGVGNKKIKELTDAGLTNINQLNNKKYFNMLNADTQLMLKHKPLRKIPNKDIKKIEVKLIAFPEALVRLVGSFRRGMPYSKDIDILVRADKPEILDEYIKYLKKKFGNKVYLYSKGSDKISLIIQPFESNNALKYKLDIFRASTETYYSNLLYSTGPKEFNIRMRARAKKIGYLLNQNGLFKKNPSGDILKINSARDDEEALFKYLDMKYLAPAQRI